MLPGQDTEEVSFTELFTSNVMLIGSPQHFFSLMFMSALMCTPHPHQSWGYKWLLTMGMAPPPLENTSCLQKLSFHLTFQTS